MEDIKDLRALQEIQDELVEQGLMKAPADAEMAMRSKAMAQKQSKRKRSPAPGGADSPYRVYESPSGFQILIGRNHAQNDALSTRIAQGEHNISIARLATVI
jgi:predicted ribosome quality control (RQC) complex YloA/Tae2 family protein